MSGTPASRRRYAVVGLGARAETFVGALAGPYAERGELVGFCDTNPTRMSVHNRWLAERHGYPAVPQYAAADFARMLDEQRPDVVLVTSMDRTHDDYIVAALEAGLDVITEKPMTMDPVRCRRILDAAEKASGSVRVAFNYRYNPVHAKVREVLASGAIGEIGSVHFEWLLDVRHGADYFRRWHRDKGNAGGLMVHKATHHFDLVNWWIASEPETVFADGKLFFYGDENGKRRGLARAYDRADSSPEAADDPFAIKLAANDKLRELYLEAEHDDGYHRDQNVFGPGITIEDDMAVLVRYTSGASLSYHLTAYSPWEGYRIGFNGSAGRLELLVRENTFATPPADQQHATAVQHGDARPGETEALLTLHPLWEPPQTLLHGELGQGHGGGDARLLESLFGDPGEDPLGRSADHEDGARSLLIGLAANQSFETGQVVKVSSLLS
ncbi:oxidoreductase family protein [Kribbella orskensis]|uniref:Oxidoreductase family protein n=1 Tax=Kribbella orskensis TaxID=2512216 RepID=A0ABY2BIF7_9ACTN|nr:MULTISPECIES: Gfo/Idh/MocA family oxidoreductase [Kribbella]TCN37716.1 oxidoreductase family protein [Kribbella sp. VKM Ac-2500]TCO18782.1 oxidoreductase family protein [Kribbella orskensis]